MKIVGHFCLQTFRRYFTRVWWWTVMDVFSNFIVTFCQQVNFDIHMYFVRRIHVNSLMIRYMSICLSLIWFLLDSLSSPKANHFNLYTRSGTIKGTLSSKFGIDFFLCSGVISQFTLAGIVGICVLWTHSTIFLCGDLLIFNKQSICNNGIVVGIFCYRKNPQQSWLKFRHKTIDCSWYI